MSLISKIEAVFPLFLFSFCLYSLKRFCNVVMLVLFLHYIEEYTSETICNWGFSLWGKFLIVNAIYLLDVGVHILLFLSFGKLCLSKTELF